MSTQIIQVRDVPDDDVAALRRSASARGMSLSAYLRELIHDDARLPSPHDLMDRIAARTPVGATSEEIRAFIAEGRTE